MNVRHPRVSYIHVVFSIKNIIYDKIALSFFLIEQYQHL